MTAVSNLAGGASALDSAHLEALLPAASEKWFPYFNLVGAGRDQALQLDRQVRQLLPGGDPDSDGYKRLLAAFIASPLTGCSTVLDQLRTEANYNAHHPTQESFMKFFYMGILSHPLFNPPLPVQDGFHFSSGPEASPNLKQMVERFKGSDATAASMIEEQLRSTLGLAVADPKVAHNSELITEYTLSAGTAIQFSYLRSSVQMAVTVMPPMNFWISANCSKGWIQFEFNQAKWPEYADATLRKHLKLAEDWSAT
jgi:hypothetical protein